MSVSYENLMVKDPIIGYENEDIFTKEWAPKVAKYREALAANVKPEYSITLPEPFESLQQKQLNAIKFLYDEELLTPQEFKITDLTTADLLQEIASKVFSSVEVLKAFAKRATICHQLTNCAMEIFIDEGLERAEYLDKYLAETGKTIGPLHGLPFSLKEHLFYKGKVCHASFVGLLDNVVTEHCKATEIFERLGAVFYIRTNQPQCLMHLDSNNNITGNSYGPFNISLSSGGSSSGEGSLVTFGGSAMGIGTDIGGSIRAPAAFSGCFGLRPTTRRISVLPCIGVGKGQESVVPVAGPITRSVEDIDLWMKHFINDGKPWEIDQDMIPLPWRQVPQPDPKKITIAVMYDNGIVKPTPPIKRGLDYTVSKLKEAGFNVIEFKAFKVDLAYKIVQTMYNADGNESARGFINISGEPVLKMTKWYLNFGEGSKPLTVTENRELNYIRDSLRQEYNDFLSKNKIDFILSPTYNNVAPKPNESLDWSYTALYNILDYPALVFQTGLFQDPEIDKWDESHKDYVFRSPLEELELNSYKPEEYVGAPIGLQLAGKRFSDEEIVATGIVISKILGVSTLKPSK